MSRPPYECDLCSRKCSRHHPFQAYGLEGYACDDCIGYDWEAYDEDADPLLYPPDPREAEDFDRAMDEAQQRNDALRKGW